MLYTLLSGKDKNCQKNLCLKASFLYVEMAQAVVCFAVERLGDLLISDAKLLHGMQCVLEEVDKKQNKDKRLQKWVTEMRELAFRVEDVIETLPWMLRPGSRNLVSRRRYEDSLVS